MRETTTGARSVIVERELPHPPEKIWRALSEPHLIGEWLAQSDFRPVVGHRFRTRREPKPGLHIVVDCEVLVVEPNRMLSYTWSAMDLDSIITWTLTPAAGGTLLRMEQSGFRPDQRQAWGGANAGWRQLLAKLEQVLERVE
jgi:uncharacterized protein YndB with AHSA1/START domain